MKNTFPILLMLLLAACKPDLQQYMVSVDKFDIDTNLLKDGDRVEIIGMSDKITKENEKGRDFYELVVVRSLEDKKVYNVLVASSVYMDQNKPILTFINAHSQINLLFEHVEELKTSDLNLNTLQAKSYAKVFYDTDFIPNSPYQTPTTVGTLGYIHIDNELNSVLNGTN